MQQASRISDFTHFFYEGVLVESGKTDQIFTNQKKRKQKTISQVNLANIYLLTFLGNLTSPYLTSSLKKVRLISVDGYRKCLIGDLLWNGYKFCLLFLV